MLTAVTLSCAMERRTTNHGTRARKPPVYRTPSPIARRLRLWRRKALEVAGLVPGVSRSTQYRWERCEQDIEFLPASFVELCRYYGYEPSVRLTKIRAREVHE